MDHAREASPKATKVAFGSYVLHDRIGAGGMAEIFLATKGALNGRGHGVERELVIKRILPSLTGDDQFTKMFVEEARLCVNLKHPNIVEVYDLGSVNDQYFIAMEYVHGRDLLKTLAACAKKRVAFPTDLALFIVMEVLKALDYAHNLRGPDGDALGIIHRDVSPSNVLLSFEGKVKLGDFGIAKASTRERTATGILKGKFGYMAPEQVMARQIDHRADVFAVGILLYELLTGHRLFAGRNDLAVLERVRDAVIDPPPRFYRPDLSRELENIVLRSLSREADDRFQSTSELHDALYNYTFKKGVVVNPRTLSKFLHELFLVDETEEHYGATAAKAKSLGVLGRASISGPDRDLSSLPPQPRKDTSNERVQAYQPPVPKMIDFDENEESTENQEPEDFEDQPTGVEHEEILPFPGSSEGARARASFSLAPQDRQGISTIEDRAAREHRDDEELEMATDMLEALGDELVPDPAEVPIRPSLSSLPIGKPSVRRVSLEPIPGEGATTGKMAPAPKRRPGSEVRAIRKAQVENGETALDLQEATKAAKDQLVAPKIPNREVSTLTPYGGVPVMTAADLLADNVTQDAGSMEPNVLMALQQALGGEHDPEIDPDVGVEAPMNDAERTDMLLNVPEKLGLGPQVQPLARPPTDELLEESLEFVEIDGTVNDDAEDMEEATSKSTPRLEHDIAPEAWIEKTSDERTNGNKAPSKPEVTATRAMDEGEDGTSQGLSTDWAEEVSLLRADALLDEDVSSRSVPRILHAPIRDAVESDEPSSMTDAPVPADVAAAWSQLIGKSQPPRRPGSSMVTSPGAAASEQPTGWIRDPSISSPRVATPEALARPPSGEISASTPGRLEEGTEPTEGEIGSTTEELGDAAREALSQVSVPVQPSVEPLPVGRPRRASGSPSSPRRPSMEPRRRVATSAALSVINPIPVMREEQPADDETRMGALARPLSSPQELGRQHTALGRLDEPISSPMLMPDGKKRRESSGVTAALSEAALVDAAIREIRSIPPETSGPMSGDYTDNGNLVDLERALGLRDDVSNSTGGRPLPPKPERRSMSKGVALFDDKDATGSSSYPNHAKAPITGIGRLGDDGAAELFGALNVLDNEPGDLELRGFDPGEEASFETTASIREAPVVPPAADPAVVSRGSIELVRPVMSGIIAPSVAAALRDKPDLQVNHSGEPTGVRGEHRDPAEEPSGIVMRFDEPTQAFDEPSQPAVRSPPRLMPNSNDSGSISSGAIIEARVDRRSSSLVMPSSPPRLTSEQPIASKQTFESMDAADETPASLEFMMQSSRDEAVERMRASGPVAPSKKSSMHPPSERNSVDAGPSLVADDFDVDLAKSSRAAAARRQEEERNAPRPSSPPSQDSAAQQRLRAVVERQRPAKEKLRTAELNLVGGQLVSEPPGAAVGQPTATNFYGPTSEPPMPSRPPMPSLPPARQPRPSMGPGLTPGVRSMPGAIPTNQNPMQRRQILTLRRALMVLAASVLVVGATLLVIVLKRPPAQAIPPVRGAAARQQPRVTPPPAKVPIAPVAPIVPVASATPAPDPVQIQKVKEAEIAAAAAVAAAAKKAEDDKREAEAEQRVEAEANRLEDRRAAAAKKNERRTPVARPAPKAAPVAEKRPDPVPDASEVRATRPGSPIKNGMGALRFDCEEPANIMIKPAGGSFTGVRKKEIQLKPGMYSVLIQRANGSRTSIPTRVVAGSPADIACNQ